MQEVFGKNGTETAEPVKATISGCLPDWLQGTLLRIGPGMFNVGDTSYNHWFDGMALIHSFTFKDGEVYYQSKFLNSETYRKNMTANRIVVSEFGTMTYPDPCKNIFSRYYPSYFHSFGLTENYIIFIEQPFKLDIVKLATAYFRGFSWGSCLKYDKDDITLIHLVDRKTGKAVSTKFYTDALVTFHHINAFEEEDHVVFDIIAYKDSKLYDMFYLSNLMKETDQFIETNRMSSPPVCQRFILPLKPNKGVTAGTNLVNLAGTKATAVQQEDGSVYCKPEALFEGTLSYTYHG